MKGGENMEKIFTILSIGLAIAAIISPICVALINNSHARKLRIEELKHDIELKKIDAELRLSEKRLDVEFNAKKEAFAKLFKCANEYYLEIDDEELFLILQSSAYEAAALCSTTDTISLINKFVYKAQQKFDIQNKQNPSELFHDELTKLSYAFAYELYGKNLSSRNDKHR